MTVKEKLAVPTSNVFRLPLQRRAVRLPLAPISITVLPPSRMRGEVVAAAKSFCSRSRPPNGLSSASDAGRFSPILSRACPPRNASAPLKCSFSPSTANSSAAR